SYYRHGFIAREEFGDNTIQGEDYVFNLQGWLKGVNSNVLDSLRDPGNDGWFDPSNPNQYFGKDVFGYSLSYFNNDYASIDPSKSGSNSFLADLNGSDIELYSNYLFDGNISSMITSITNPTTKEKLPMGTSYKYDQLNRILESRSFSNLELQQGSPDFNTWGNTGSFVNKYFNQFSYDANGNILTQKRHDDAGVQIDNLTYNYNVQVGGKLQNRLYHLNDTVSVGTFSDDIDDMGMFNSSANTINTANNYGYDEIGQLIRDDQEEIAEIKWRVDGRVSEIIRVNGSSKKNLKFDYNAAGRRIAKHIYTSNGDWIKSTYYVTDASNKAIAVYEHSINDTIINYNLKENHIYGYDLIGMRLDTLEMIGATMNSSTFYRTLRKKNYYMKNHLGNNLSVVSDVKIPIDINTDLVVDGYEAHLVASMDYSPFGVILKNRNFNSSKIRHGFQLQERDDEIKGEGNSIDFENRMMDTRVGRFLSMDMLKRNYSYLSPYSFAENMPIQFIELKGMQTDIDAARKKNLEAAKKSFEMQQKEYQDKKATFNQNRQGINPQGNTPTFPEIPAVPGNWRGMITDDRNDYADPQSKVFYAPNGQQGGSKGSYIRVFPDIQVMPVPAGQAVNNPQVQTWNVTNPQNTVPQTVNTITTRVPIPADANTQTQPDANGVFQVQTTQVTTITLQTGNAADMARLGVVANTLQNQLRGTAAAPGQNPTVNVVVQFVPGLVVPPDQNGVSTANDFQIVVNVNNITQPMQNQQTAVYPDGTTAPATGETPGGGTELYKN
ncbi:MAG: hypothetical protein ACK40M_10620, partial [Flavobacteriales bacterium]